MIDVRQKNGKLVIVTDVRLLPSDDITGSRSAELPIETYRLWGAAGEEWQPMGPAMTFDSEVEARQYITTNRQKLTEARALPD